MYQKKMKKFSTCFLKYFFEEKVLKSHSRETQQENDIDKESFNKFLHNKQFINRRISFLFLFLNNFISSLILKFGFDENFPNLFIFVIFGLNIISFTFLILFNCYFISNRILHSGIFTYFMYFFFDFDLIFCCIAKNSFLEFKSDCSLFNFYKLVLLNFCLSLTVRVIFFHKVLSRSIEIITFIIYQAVLFICLILIGNFSNYRTFSKDIVKITNLIFSPEIFTIAFYVIIFLYFLERKKLFTNKIKRIINLKSEKCDYYQNLLNMLNKSFLSLNTTSFKINCNSSFINLLKRMGLNDREINYAVDISDIREYNRFQEKKKNLQEEIKMRNKTIKVPNDFNNNSNNTNIINNLFSMDKSNNKSDLVFYNDLAHSNLPYDSVKNYEISAINKSIPDNNNKNKKENCFENKSNYSKQVNKNSDSIINPYGINDANKNRSIDFNIKSTFKLDSNPIEIIEENNNYLLNENQMLKNSRLNLNNSTLNNNMTLFSNLNKPEKNDFRRLSGNSIANPGSPLKFNKNKNNNLLSVNLTSQYNNFSSNFNVNNSSKNNLMYTNNYLNLYTYDLRKKIPEKVNNNKKSNKSNRKISQEKRNMLSENLFLNASNMTNIRESKSFKYPISMLNTVGNNQNAPFAFTNIQEELFMCKLEFMLTEVFVNFIESNGNGAKLTLSDCIRRMFNCKEDLEEDDDFTLKGNFFCDISALKVQKDLKETQSGNQPNSNCLREENEKRLKEVSSFEEKSNNDKKEKEKENISIELYYRKIVTPEGELIEFYFNDITSVSRVEKEKAENKIRSLVLAKISHEFKTPLITIIYILKNCISSEKIFETEKPNNEEILFDDNSNLQDSRVIDSCEDSSKMIIRNNSFRNPNDVKIQTNNLNKNKFMVSVNKKEVENIYPNKNSQELTTNFNSRKEIKNNNMNNPNLEINKNKKNKSNLANSKVDRSKRVNSELELKTKENYIKNTIDLSDYMLSLINDIIDFSVIDTNFDLKFQYDYFDLHALLNFGYRILKILIDCKGLGRFITPAIEIADNVPQEFFSDEMRIKQVLLNLVSNSIKFTRRGYIKITAKAFSKKGVEIAVEDSGIGISKEDLKKLFYDFGKLQNAEAVEMNKTGSGLGLSICRKITSSLGTPINVLSHPNEKTRFFFTLVNKSILIKSSTALSFRFANRSDRPTEENIIIDVNEDLDCSIDKLHENKKRITYNRKVKTEEILDFKKSNKSKINSLNPENRLDNEANYFNSPSHMIKLDKMYEENKTNDLDYYRTNNQNYKICYKNKNSEGNKLKFLSFKKIQISNNIKDDVIIKDNNNNINNNTYNYIDYTAKFEGNKNEISSNKIFSEQTSNQSSFEESIKHSFILNSKNNFSLDDFQKTRRSLGLSVQKSDKDSATEAIETKSNLNLYNEIDLSLLNISNNNANKAQRLFRNADCNSNNEKILSKKEKPNNDEVKSFKNKQNMIGNQATNKPRKRTFSLRNIFNEKKITSLFGNHKFRSVKKIFNNLDLPRKTYSSKIQAKRTDNLFKIINDTNYLINIITPDKKSQNYWKFELNKDLKNKKTYNQSSVNSSFSNSTYKENHENTSNKNKKNIAPNYFINANQGKNDYFYNKNSKHKIYSSNSNYKLEYSLVPNLTKNPINSKTFKSKTKYKDINKDKINSYINKMSNLSLNRDSNFEKCFQSDKSYSNNNLNINSKSDIDITLIESPKEIYFLDILSEKLNSNLNRSFSHHFINTIKHLSKKSKKSLNNLSSEDGKSLKSLKSQIKININNNIQNYNNLSCQTKHFSEQSLQIEKKVVDIQINPNTDYDSNENKSKELSNLEIFLRPIKKYFKKIAKAHIQSLILVVDDNEIIRNSIKKLIKTINKTEKKNIGVICLGDGIDLINLVMIDQIMKNMIKLIISDEQMIYLNGTATFKILNDLVVERKINKIPFVFCSSNNENSAIIMKDEFDDMKNKQLKHAYLNKPPSKTQIRAIFETFCI